MDRALLIELLNRVAAGGITPAEALERLKTLPFEDLGFARVDRHRALRRGFPEVIFGAGKRPAQIARIFQSLAESGGSVLATRVGPRAASRVCAQYPAAVYDACSRTLTLRQGTATPRGGFVGVVCAGTSDLPVAEEARITAEVMGSRVEKFYDVGVAGIHRLLAESPRLREARALVVAAGMEGALPSVVGGLVDCPVIAVPTSVGYGASFGGVAALLAMLNSCASGVSVVNIDNGFGAGYQAAVIDRMIEEGGRRGVAAPEADRSR